MNFKSGFLKKRRTEEPDVLKNEKGKKFKSGSKNNEAKELGFGTTLTELVRTINTDGTFNVKRIGAISFHPYQALASMSWKKFNLLVLTSFVVINFFFAILYMFTGDKELNGIEPNLPLWRKFSEMFFFSCQTFTSVGYGRVNPGGFYAGIISSLEALIGLLALAFATGLLFARFSRPSADLIYSNNALIAPYKEGKAFMFKFANRRANQLIEIDVQVSLSVIVNENGKLNRRFYNLPLEVSKVNFFPLTWTIVHVIKNESPLEDFNSWQELKDNGAEVLIMVKAFDDTFSQTVYNRYSYVADEMVWGAKYISNFHPADGMIVLDLDKMNEIEIVNLDS